MSLFQCENCGCAENTALTCGYIKADFYTKEFNWRTALGSKEMRLCSACSPSKYANGKDAKKGGKWHDQFKRAYLPKGEFFTNRHGNLEHKETGSENYHLFEIERP